MKAIQENENGWRKRRKTTRSNEKKKRERHNLGHKSKSQSRLPKKLWSREI